MATELFGGALSAVLPPQAEDVSKVREIPDNQEVYTQALTDQSIIVEILEYVQEPDEQAVKTHFDELSESNDVQGDNSQVLQAESIATENLAMEDCESAYYVLGKQWVAKFNEQAKNQLNIHMVLLRLPRYNTDILVTFNDPTNINPESSSHQAVPTSVTRWALEDFYTIVHSLQVHDPTIFGE